MAPKALSAPATLTSGKLIVDISTGEVEDRAPAGPPKNEAAAELGRMGGRARADSMTAERRAEDCQESGGKALVSPLALIQRIAKRLSDDL